MPDLVHNISSNGDSDTDSNSADDEGMPEPARASKKEGGAKRSSREDAYTNAAPEGGSRTDKDSKDHHAPASKRRKPAAAATRKKNRFVDDEAVDDGSDGGTCEGDGDGDLQVDDRGNIPGLVKGSDEDSSESNCERSEDEGRGEDEDPVARRRPRDSSDGGGDEGEGGAGRGDDGTGEDGGAEDDDDEEDEAFSRRGSKRKNKMAVASDSDEDAGADRDVAAPRRRRIVVSDSDDEDEEVDGGDGQEVVCDRREPEDRGPIAVVHGKKPLGDFSHQSQLVAAVYPQHFPQARGMMFDPYRRHNRTFTPTQWKRLTFGLSNRARAEDAFLLDLNNMESRRRMLLHAQLRFKRRGGGTQVTAKELSSGRLKEVVDLLAAGRTRDEIYKTHPQYARLMQNVSAVSGLVPGTVHARKRKKAEMVGLATERSALNVWFTLNLDEFGDGNIVLLAGFPDGRLKECKTVAVKREFLETLVARDPAALATWFLETNVAMIKHVFGFDVSAKTANLRGSPGRRGLFGTVLDYFAPLECAQRGGLHAHYVIWTVEGALLRRFCMDDDLMPLVAGINARFIDSVVSAQAQACIEQVTPEGTPVVALLGAAEAAKLDSYIDRRAVLNRDPGTGVPYALEPTALPPTVATVAELQKRRAELLAPVQKVCVILRQLQRDNLRVLVGVGAADVGGAVPPIGRIQRTLLEFLDRDGGVAAAAMKGMWTTAVHSLATVERGVAALNVRVSVGVTVRNILRCFQRRCFLPVSQPCMRPDTAEDQAQIAANMNGIGVAFTPYRPTQLGATAATVGGGDDGEAALHERRLDGGASDEENIPSLRRIQRTILGFLHGPQEAYDARVVCETGGIVVQRLLHGLRHLVAQNPEYVGQNFRTCRKVTASSHPNHSFRFYASSSLLYGVLSHMRDGFPRSCSLDSLPLSHPYRPIVFQDQDGFGAGAVSLRLWIDRAQIVLVHPLFSGQGAPAAERFRARRSAQ